ncbi:MAG: ACP S-malonyltransferase [Gammaproteobacteria bacterium]|nr:ACP S-malonyltransferase [Gammaproteobacteria bacterium]
MMKIAAVFPGQGSQSVAMLADLAASHAEVQATFAEASQRLDYDLWQLVQEGPVEKLNQTEFTQPAMLAAGVATYRVWRATGGAEPELLAGHSLGEYSALVVAGVLSLADAAWLVSERGRLMQSAVPAGKGAMAAILGLSDEQVIEVCRAATQGEVVEAVNFNSSGQVVIAGQTAAVERAMSGAKEAGAKRALPLPVSVPSHSSLMTGAADQLATCFAQIEFSEPKIPVLQNVTAEAASDLETLKGALKQQLFSPVQWVKCVQNLQAAEADVLLELGPGKVLTGLAKRIDRRFASFAVADTATLEKALTHCKGE